MSAKEGKVYSATSDLAFFKKNGYFKIPKYLQVEITDFCPLNCPQCYKADTQAMFMDEERFSDIVGQVQELGSEHIFYNGGEPLCHPKFVSFLHITAEKGLAHTVFTSGYGINEDFIFHARVTGLNINLSLNGSNKVINEFSRDGFEVAIRAATLLKMSKYPFQINWVARSDNVRDLPNLISLGKKIGASAINVVCNKMTSHGEIISPLTESDYSFLVEIIRKYQDYIMVQNCYGLLLSLLGSPCNKLYGCQAGIRVMAITCDGDFMPCTHLHYPESFHNLLTYWENSRYLAEIRQNVNMKYCDTCNFCRFCHSMSKESHDDLQVGFEMCPIREKYRSGGIWI